MPAAGLNAGLVHAGVLVFTVIVTVKVVDSTSDSEVDSGPIQEQRIVGESSSNYERHRFMHDFQHDFRCLQLAIVV
jgi:hypothetical protein